MGRVAPVLGSIVAWRRARANRTQKHVDTEAVPVLRVLGAVCVTPHAQLPQLADCMLAHQRVREHPFRQWLEQFGIRRQNIWLRVNHTKKAISKGGAHS